MAERRLIARRLRELGSPADAEGAKRYFKEPAKFLGIRAPVLRALAREHQSIALGELEAMLDSAWHEERMLALLILVRRYRKEPEAVHFLYLRKIDRIDNWALVDTAARDIVGAHGDVKLLRELAKSKSVWKRRIAVVATQFFIRRGEFDETLRLAKSLLRDEEDLIHKAVGWMLREVGDRDIEVLRGFLAKHARDMPRTMLRYAIEKMTSEERKRWMSG